MVRWGLLIGGSVVCFSLINVNNDNFVEIKKTILMANKGLYGLKRQFRSQFLSIKNKIIQDLDQTSAGIRF